MYIAASVILALIALLILAKIIYSIVLKVRASLPRWKKAIRDYGRLFAKPHIKATVVTLAVIGVAAAMLDYKDPFGAFVAWFITGWIAIWVRKIWITDDYDRAAKAAADAERVREQARRQREAQRVPEPSISYLYSVFGLSQNATDAEIRTAYRRLVKKYHPDRVKYSSAANAEMFRRVQEAYAELRAMRGSWIN
jgi:hypothetical protein